MSDTDKYEDWIFDRYGPDELEDAQNFCEQRGKYATHRICQSCGSGPASVRHHVVNHQRKNMVTGRPAMIAEDKPLRWIPQHKLLTAHICDRCNSEYNDSIIAGEFILVV